MAELSQKLLYDGYGKVGQSAYLPSTDRLVKIGTQEWLKSGFVVNSSSYPGLVPGGVDSNLEYIMDVNISPELYEINSGTKSMVFATLVYGNGVLLGIPNYGATFYYISYDLGYTWEFKNTLPFAVDTTTNRQICFGNGKFVLCRPGSDGCAVSTDGVHWSTSSLPRSGGWVGIAFGAGTFVMVDHSTYSLYSHDGITWLKSNDITSTAWARVTYENGLFFKVSNIAGNIYATSPDGIIWTERALPNTSAIWNNVSYGNGIYVFIPYNAYSNFATSTDGINWTRQSSTPAPVTGIRFVYDRFFAWSNNRLMMSTDGIIWGEIDLNKYVTSMTIGDVIFVEGQIMISGINPNTLFINIPNYSGIRTPIPYLYTRIK